MYFKLNLSDKVCNGLRESHKESLEESLKEGQS